MLLKAAMPLNFISREYLSPHKGERIESARLAGTAVARTLIGGGVFIHIFMFCPTSFF